MEKQTVPTALIVDDDIQFLTFLSHTLKRGGFSVLTASDGCEVSELLAHTQVDLLVLDLQMPGMNGWEVLRSLRDSPNAVIRSQNKPRPKIVVVSGRNEDETVTFVRRLGADAYLMKPLWGDELLSTVRSVMSH